MWADWRELSAKMKEIADREGLPVTTNWDVLGARATKELEAEAGAVQLLDEPDEPVGWWGPWVFLLLLLVGSIVLWHLLGAPVWEGGF